METLAHRRDGWRRLLPPSTRDVPGTLRAIIPVDIFGRVAEMAEIVGTARSLGVSVIEDACEAVGASLDGVAAGRWGEAGAFGFYPNKQMTTGEGGLLLTDDDEWATVIRSLRSQGRSDDGALRHQRIGYNYRLNELSAAVGLAQFRRLDELLAKRAAVAAMYDQRIAAIDGIEALGRPRAGMNATHFLYIVRVADDIDRDELAHRMAARGVPTRPYFWPIHLQPPYRQRFGFDDDAYPHSVAAGRSLLALPFHGALTEQEVERVCETLAASIPAQRAASR
jgi:perosamine synthetase